MIKIQLLTLMLCLAHVVYGADYGWNDGPIPDSITAGANFMEDTNMGLNDGISITPDNNFNILGLPVTNFYVRTFSIIVSIPSTEGGLNTRSQPLV